MTKIIDVYESSEAAREVMTRLRVVGGITSYLSIIGCDGGRQRSPWNRPLLWVRLSEHKRYFLARDAEGRLEGMLACSPIYGRRGWYLEDLIRRCDAKRGVSELLIVEAIGHLAAEGAELATLATSPLAGIERGDLNGSFKHLARALTLIYEHLELFYHFKALHHFKSKFAPSFVEREYVAIYPPRIRLRMIQALIGALDPAGFTGILASKLRRLWRMGQRSVLDGRASPGNRTLLR